MTEGGGQMTDDRRQMTDDRGRMTEGGGRRIEKIEIRKKERGLGQGACGKGAGPTAI